MNRSIVALDVGTGQRGSGWLRISTTATPHDKVCAENTSISWAEMSPNEVILDRLRDGTWGRNSGVEFVFEGISSFGNQQGGDIHRTLLWIGRMIEAVEASTGSQPKMVLRVTARAFLAGAKATDAAVAQVVRERFGGPGATRSMVCGTKAEPGPLYGFKKDIWQAAAVGIAYVEGARLWTGWE